MGNEAIRPPALVAAHGRGMIHRDLKPGSVRGAREGAGPVSSPG
jgi:hypothetical protein